MKLSNIICPVVRELVRGLKQHIKGGDNLLKAIAPTEPHDESQHCGTIKRLDALVCKACRREIPWELMRDLRCAEHVAIYHAKKDARPWLILAEATERVKASTRAIFNHLKQHSSAL